MSDILRNRTNLLNNDGFRTTSALTAIFPVLGKSPTGATCGTDRNRAAEALCDHEVERAQAGRWGRRSDVEPFRPAGARGR